MLGVVSGGEMTLEQACPPETQGVTTVSVAVVVIVASTLAIGVAVVVVDVVVDIVVDVVVVFVLVVVVAAVGKIWGWPGGFPYPCPCRPVASPAMLRPLCMVEAWNAPSLMSGSLLAMTSSGAGHAGSSKSLGWIGYTTFRRVRTGARGVKTRNNAA